MYRRCKSPGYRALSYPILVLIPLITLLLLFWLRLGLCDGLVAALAVTVFA